jgi:hypothetical protein
MVALRCPISAPESPANKSCNERRKKEKRKEEAENKGKRTIAVEIEFSY